MFEAESSSVPNLKLKLKIPKITNQELPIQQEIVKSHVCKDCNKSFSSGKALGGHMSSAHVQAQANSKDQDYKLKSSKKANLGFRCKICGRDFHSRKSLFGHMKSHPDRHWRGMDPPEDEKSEEESDFDDFSGEEEDRSEEEGINQADLVGPVRDLSASLKGWGATGKRGRGEPDSEPDEEQVQLHAAVHLLIRMVNDPVPTRNEVVAENRACGPRPAPEKMVVCDNVALVEKSRSISEGGETGSKTKRAKVDEIRSPGIRGKVSDSSVTPTPTSTPGKVFSCNSCGKTFSTYQALGGHRSSHNKPRVSISNTIDDVDTKVFGSSSNAKTPRGYSKLFGNGKGVPNEHILGGYKKFQGTNLGDMVTSYDQAATTGNVSTQANVVGRVPYFGFVPYGSQATFGNGSNQGSPVDRASTSEQATAADVRPQEPRRTVLLDLNEIPDEEEN